MSALTRESATPEEILEAIAEAIQIRRGAAGIKAVHLLQPIRQIIWYVDGESAPGALQPPTFSRHLLDLFNIATPSDFGRLALAFPMHAWLMEYVRENGTSRLRRALSLSV